MNLNKIKSISDKNINRIIVENLYRGWTEPEQCCVFVQCMNKDVTIKFDFKEEQALIIKRDSQRQVPIELMAPKRTMAEIIKMTC